jgi:hypothetical protein
MSIVINGHIGYGYIGLEIYLMTSRGTVTEVAGTGFPLSPDRYTDFQLNYPFYLIPFLTSVYYLCNKRVDVNNFAYKSIINTCLFLSV